jgi:CRP/FNR family transcriptional regulator
MIMPSARQVKTQEVAEAPASDDLLSLWRKFHASNTNYLNSVHGRGKMLFAEGEPARGVYILRTGRATVSITSSEGRVVILRIAQAGDVLGLNSVLKNSAYDVTVRTLEPCRLEFLPRADLLALMGTNQPVTQVILKILSQEMGDLTERMRSLLLLQTMSSRLANLMLEWGSQSVRIDRVFTHEEIAQMICSSRETVTRLLATMSRREMIAVTSDSILIRDHAALARMALG